MAKQYRWQIQNYYQKDSGDDNFLTGGAESADLNWHDENEGYKALGVVTYYYHDTNTKWTGSGCHTAVGYWDEPGSIVEYPVTQSWTASYDAMNNLTINIHTEIGTVKRSKTPLQCGSSTYYDTYNTMPRWIEIYKGSDTQNPFDSTVDNTVGDWGSMDPKTLFNSMDLGTYTLTLAPGSSAEISSLKINNNSTISYDILWAGVRFQNPQPAAVTYTLNYNANGGSGAPAAQTVTTVDNSHTFTISNTVPTRTNYRFDGWCENSGGTGTVYQPGGTYTISRSDPTKTLYAKWTPYWNATVTYNANGGTGAPAAQTASVSPDYNSKSFTVPSGTPTWGHYKFLGWSHIQYVDSRTDADVEYRAGDTVTVTKTSPSLTLYAVWMMDYRPGATLNTSTNIWKSHNRTNGACHVLSNTGNMTWQECRTIGGAEGDKGNPPLILTAANANSWRNQKLLGKE